MLDGEPVVLSDTELRTCNASEEISLKKSNKLHIYAIKTNINIISFAGIDWCSKGLM